MADVKFCGLTRSSDVEEAVRLGARYVGVILASGPRLLRPEEAHGVLAPARGTVDSVGVFGDRPASAIIAEAGRAGVRVVQLHADPAPDLVSDVRRQHDGEVWAVLRVAGDAIPDDAAELFATADGVVLDARSERGLGGTGVALPWARLADRLDALRGGPAKLILAGGLNPGNVADAIETLAPDVVDVSSGVESAPGIKDHSLMGAFARAARTRKGAA